MSWEWVVWARWKKLLSHLGKFFRVVEKAGVTVDIGHAEYVLIRNYVSSVLVFIGKLLFSSCWAPVHHSTMVGDLLYAT